MKYAVVAFLLTFEHCDSFQTYSRRNNIYRALKERYVGLCTYSRWNPVVPSWKVSKSKLPLAIIRQNQQEEEPSDIQKINNGPFDSHPSQQQSRGNKKRGHCMRSPVVRSNSLRQVLGDRKRSAEIDDWMRELVLDNDRVCSSSEKKKRKVFPDNWTSRDETDFIRILRDFDAYEAIELFVQYIARKNVYAYTAGISALANSKRNNSIRQRAFKLLHQMDDNGILPSSFTYAALFQAVDGPDEAKKVMQRLQIYKSKVKWSVEAFNQAIIACNRRSQSKEHRSNKSWQVALDFFRMLRRERLSPNLKTYISLLYVCAQSGQLRIALSLLQELESTPGLEPNAKVWGAFLNVCAQAGDYRQANITLERMQQAGCQITVVHCSAFLKALSRAGKVSKSFRVLDMMLGTKTKNDALDTDSDHFKMVSLSPVAPDLIALNTILAACSKAGDFSAARELLDRMKNAEFLWPGTSHPIMPDEISYSLLLSSCRDPQMAKSILKEIKLTRRHRVGVVKPTSITYARAIAVCRKAQLPDVETARFFLESAREDGVEPTLFMYSAAIWTAEGAGDWEAALAMLHEMESNGITPNTIAYNGVISAMAQQGRGHEAKSLYQHMREKSLCRPTVHTFKALVSAFRSLGIDNTTDTLEMIWATMEGSERFTDVGGTVIEALIKAYGKAGSYSDAKRVFDSIEGPTDSASLRAILLACAKAEPTPLWKEAISILHSSDITAGALGPGKMDQAALSNGLIACAKADEWEEAWNLLQLYGAPTTERMSSSLSVVALNALIAACGRKGRPDVAVHILNTMEMQYGVKPDERSFRSAVIACNQAEHEKRRQTSYGRDEGDDLTRNEISLQWWECSLALLRRMRESSLQPDIQTFSSCISACEAAGQWQRALGVLQSMIDESSEGKEETVLNLFCFNAAVSSCEKGGAWVEALEIYERMLSYGGLLKPNFVTLSSLVLALVNAGQNELAQSKYEEGTKMKIVNPWKVTKDSNGQQLKAMDLHQFNYAMASTAVRSLLDSLLYQKSEQSVSKGEPLVIIVGKGLRSTTAPVLLPTLQELLQEHGIAAKVDPSNAGRLLVDGETLRSFVAKRS